MWNIFTSFYNTIAGFFPGPIMYHAHIIPGGAMWEKDNVAKKQQTNNQAAAYSVENKGFWDSCYNI